MNKGFYFICAFSAALLLAGCQEKISEIAPVKATHSVTFTAEKIVDTRTAIASEENGTVSYKWISGDEARMQINEISALGDTAVGTITTMALSNNDRTATFNVTFAGEAPAGEVTYKAAYAGHFSNAGNLQIPATQSPLEASFDPNADAMVADAIVKASGREANPSFLFNMNRVVSVNKMTLKGLTPGETVKTVTFESNKNHTGYYNVSTGSYTTPYGQKLTLSYTANNTVPANGEFPVYFTTMPVTDATFAVTVVTNSKRYTKTSSKTISFAVGEVRRFGVALPEGQPIESVEGDYLIASFAGNEWHLMSPYLGQNKYYPGVGTNVTTAANVIAYSDFSNVTDLSDYHWRVEAYGEGYSIRSLATSNYLYYSPGNSPSNEAEANSSLSVHTCFDVTIVDKLATIKSLENSTRVLRYNSSGSSNRFAFYGGTQNDIYLIPAVDDGLTTVTLSFTNAVINTNTNDYSGVTGQTVIADPNVSAITNAITYSITGDAIGTVNASTGVVSLNGTAGTATVTADFAGDNTYRAAQASYTITVLQSVSTGWVETAISNISVADVFVIVGNDSYAMSNDKGTSTGPDAVAVTVSGTALTGTISDNIKWTVSGNGNDQYTFYPYGSSTTWLYCTSSNNGVRVGTNNDKTFTLNANNYLVHVATSRILSIYNNADWRCYTNTNNNPQSIKFYKWVDGTTWNLSSIAVTNPPAKTTYIVSEFFNPAGIVVEATYTDANDPTHTKSIDVTSLVTYSPNTSTALTANDNSVTITFTEGNVVKTTNQAITVNEPSLDFTTVAELNAAVTTTSSSYSGRLTNAVVSFVPATNTAIIKDATGSVMYYKNNHGLKQGQTFSGDIVVTAVKYNGLYSEITAMNASFTGTQSVVAPESVALSALIGNYDDYQNAYVQVSGLEVTAVNNKNVTVSDGNNNSYVVYTNYGNATCEVGDIITAVGTVTKNGTTEEIKVWAAADLTVTYHPVVSNAVTFTQPSAGGSFTVKVDGSTINSGDLVEQGKTVTLEATAASGYSFTSWTVSGATVSGNTATATFTMGATAVNISATFTIQSGNPTTTNYSLAFNDIGTTGWSSSYADHNNVYNDNVVSISLKASSKQTSTITDYPVTKAGEVIVVMNNSKTLTAVTFTLTQWGSKSKTVSLQYSTDGGSTFSALNPVVSSSNFSLSASSLPAGTNAVKMVQGNTSNQVGLVSISITYN